MFVGTPVPQEDFYKSTNPCEDYQSLCKNRPGNISFVEAPTPARKPILLSTKSDSPVPPFHPRNYLYYMHTFHNPNL